MRKNGNNELNRGTKKTFASILPIIGASLLSAGAIAGVAVSAWHVSQTYKESSEFSNSTTARVEIDPVAFEAEGLKADKATAEKNTKYAAEKLSAWLKQNGQDSYDVSYELKAPEKAGAQYFAYLSAKFKLNKINSKLTTDKDQIDNDPYLSIFDSKGFNTNNKSFVYRWYESEKSAADADPKYSVLNFSDLFVIPDTVDQTGADTKTMNDKDNKAGIVYKINEKNVDFLNKIYKDLLKYEAATKQTTSNKEIDAKLQPRIYIINNLEGMINEASYHLTNWGYHVDDSQELVSYEKIYKDSDYAKFAKEYSTKTWKGSDRSTYVKRLGDARLTVDGTEATTTTLKNGDILNWIDSKTPGTVEQSVIFSKYVEDCIPFAKVKDYIRDNIDDNNIKNTIPTKEGDDCKITYFWHPYANTNAATTYFKNMIEKGWKKAKIVEINLNSSSSWKDNYNQYKGNYQTTIVAPKFTETVFGGNQLIGALSFGFLIYLVILGILLACLYRMTGVFSWICMMFMLSMTGLIAVFGTASVISLSLLFGLFVMSIAGFITAVGICGRMRRRLLSNEDTQVIVSKTFKQSLWPSADISIIALIFGVCFTYIAPLGLNPLGLVLVIGAFANFIGTYLFNGLLHGLFFNNRNTINHFGLFGRTHSNRANEAISQGRNDIPVSLDATKLNFQYYSKLSGSKNKLNVTGKAANIGLIVAGAILIVAIILFTVLGFINSNMFHAENCLVVLSSDANVVNWVKDAGLNYTSYLSSKDATTWYFYTTSIGSDVITKLTAAHPGVTAYAQTIVGETNRDLLIFALISTIVAASASTVYAGIRCNWTAFVPMLAAGMGLPLVMLGIASVAQIKFDETVVLAYAMITVVNQIVSIAIINSINSVWSRREGYSKAELKFIVNESLKNDQFWLILAVIGYALFIVAFMLTAPKGCTNIDGLLAIGLLVTFVAAPFVISALLYRFLVIRNAALKKRAIKKANKKVVNYDEIDEQGIEGLNKFSKKIAVPKEEAVANEQK